MEERPLEALEPHSYPAWIKVVAVLIVCLATYVLYTSLPYFTATQEFTHAQELLEESKINEAIPVLEVLHEKYPQSDSITIALIQAYLQSKEDGYLMTAFAIMDDLELTDGQWDEIDTYMPERVFDSRTDDWDEYNKNNQE